MIRQAETVFTFFTFNRLATMLLFVAVGSAACLMPAQNDTWWHLRAGQEIWRTGSVALRDTFSHTMYGAYWPDQEWLSEAIGYAIYHVGGLPLLTAAAAAAATATWAIVWRLTQGSVVARMVVSAFAIPPVSIAWSLRPHLLTLLMLALTAWLIARRRLWPLPFVFLVWANLHGGFMLGLVCLGASTLWAAVYEREHVRGFVLATAASALATNGTPLGFSEWPEIAGAVMRIRQYPISEWQPPALSAPVFLPFWVAAAALVVLAATRRLASTEQSLGPLSWSALALLPLAVTASRNVPPFLILAVPVLAAGLKTRPTFQDRAAGLKTRPFRWWGAPHTRREHPALNAAILAKTVVAGIAVVAHAWSTPLPRLGWHPLPDAAIAAVQACPDPLYNRWDEGGFLVWFTPDRKVFIDGRQDPYPPDLVAAHLRVETDGDYEPLFARFGIECAFLPDSSPVATKLLAAGWDRRYDQTPWLVLAKP